MRARDRRLRHRVLVAQLAAAPPGRHAEDRQGVRRRHLLGRRGRGRHPGDRSARRHARTRHRGRRRRGHRSGAPAPRSWAATRSKASASRAPARRARATPRATPQLRPTPARPGRGDRLTGELREAAVESSTAVSRSSVSNMTKAVARPESSISDTTSSSASNAEPDTTCRNRATVRRALR